MFEKGKYDGLFNSIVFTFKLENAYLTNLVKCGLNKDNKHKTISQGEYEEKCIETCFGNVLLKEIEALKPKVVFCFGSNVNRIFLEKYKKGTTILLPHPARCN